METVTETPVETEETEAEETAPSTNGSPPVAVAEKSREKIFEFSRYIHVGEGADECPNGTNGKCQDDGHYHAWVRLANPFQVRDILEKANAAKARKMRELRDPNSDARLVLEDELEQIRESDAKDILIDEIIEVDYLDDHGRAVREVDEEEDPDFVPSGDDVEPPKRWATIDQDREEFERQVLLPEDQREGFEAIEKHVRAYHDAVTARVEEIRQTRRVALQERDWDELLDMVRRERMEVISSEAYLHAFNTWQWYVCTFKPKPKGTPNERVYTDMSQLRFGESPETIKALREAFDEMESNLARSRAAKNF